MLQTIWTAYVDLFVGGLIIPAILHPIMTCSALVALTAASIVWGR